MSNYQSQNKAQYYFVDIFRHIVTCNGWLYDYPGLHDWIMPLWQLIKTSVDDQTRSSESDGRSDFTDSLECPDKFRVP